MQKDIRKHDRSSITILGWLQTANPSVAEVLATCGFDAVVYDMEHGPASEVVASDIFTAIERHGALPMARLPSADPYLARRLLDLGCAGLLIPVVEDAGDFMTFAKHCLYPPAGKRGLGLSRANQWGGTFETYSKDFQPVLIPQIETKKGAANAGKIVALDCVDGLFIGPYDLSADLGAPGDFESEEFNQAISEIKNACTSIGKLAGIHQVEPDPAALQARIADGYRFLAYGTDAIAIRHAFRDFR